MYILPALNTNDSQICILIYLIIPILLYFSCLTTKIGSKYSTNIIYINLTL